MTAITKGSSQRSTKVAVFKPRPSNGWLWVGVIGVALLALAAVITNMTAADGVSFMLTYLPGAVIGLIGLVFLLLAALFPTMRYEVKAGRLFLYYGPFQLEQVELDQVQKVRKCDLGFSPVSSLRFPGLALSKVHYAEVGVVHMCATSAFHSILLIETPGEKYGVTPADEAAFMAELQKRMGA